MMGRGEGGYRSILPLPPLPSAPLPHHLLRAFHAFCGHGFAYICHFSPHHNILYPEDFEIVEGCAPQTGEVNPMQHHPVQLCFGGRSGKLIRVKLTHPFMKEEHGEHYPPNPMKVPQSSRS